MSKSWQLIIIIAFFTVGLYTGFEIYNSIIGKNTDFKYTVEPINNDLGTDVLDHINNSINELYYKNEDTNITENTIQDNTR
jgi:hypothetical protein